MCIRDRVFFTFPFYGDDDTKPMYKVMSLYYRCVFRPIKSLGTGKPKPNIDGEYLVFDASNSGYPFSHHKTNGGQTQSSTLADNELADDKKFSGFVYDARIVVDDNYLIEIFDHLSKLMFGVAAFVATGFFYDRRKPESDQE